MSKNNLAIVKTVDEEMLDESWERLKDALNTVLTLDKVNNKPLYRTGKVMQKALNDLFFSIGEYDALRNRK